MTMTNEEHVERFREAWNDPNIEWVITNAKPVLWDYLKKAWAEYREAHKRWVSTIAFNRIVAGDEHVALADLTEEDMKRLVDMEVDEGPSLFNELAPASESDGFSVKEDDNESNTTVQST